METVFHSLSEVLARRGLTGEARLSRGDAAEIAVELGCSVKTVKDLKCALKRADGDPGLAARARGRRGTPAGKPPVARGKATEGKAGGRSGTRTRTPVGTRF